MQARGGGLEHDAQRGRYLAQWKHFRTGHGARVDMWQQTGFIEDQLSHRRHIGKRVAVAHCVQCRLGLGVAQFRALAEGQQGLAAASLGAGAGDRQYFLGAQVGAGQFLR
ncbi:hypothetical protein D3C85_1219080 [compost metagenome]